MTQENHIRHVATMVIDALSELTDVVSNDETLKGVILAAMLVAVELEVTKESLFAGIDITYESVIKAVNTPEPTETTA